MPTNQEIEVKSLPTSVQSKKLNSTYWLRTMTSNAAYYHSNSDALTTGNLTVGSDPDCLIAFADEYVSIEFRPSDTGGDGQGITIPDGFKEVKVVSVSGTCKRFLAKNIAMSKKKSDMWSQSGTTPVANDILYPGDMLLAAQLNSKFELRFTAFPQEEGSMIVGFPIGLLFTSQY
ncbi:MAG: hypothetical protein FJY65_05440 [Calditrichaeota bacterium]|nr:hypothetical protein [Calditrichota bacterium]